LAEVAIYFFEMTGDVAIIDYEGIESPKLEAVEKEAARILAELTLNVIPRSVQRVLAGCRQTLSRPNPLIRNFGV